MSCIGIICEYNPLHLGHEKQLQAVRAAFGADCEIVCLMSGAYVQRGAPAIFAPELRAKAAILTGADLVLELPVTYALSSAEGFASGGVAILSEICDALCFGTERLERASLLTLAEALCAPAFSEHLRAALSAGCSFPAARQQALERMGLSNLVSDGPNDILAAEYCKAILKQGAPLDIFPIHRPGDYHAAVPDPENPSASAIRAQIEAGAAWLQYVPDPARACLAQAAVHTLSAGERAVLAKLRTMTDEEFSHLPFGSEGLWRKLMHSARSQPTLEAVISAVKSKRYTRTRINRMILCAFLGISGDILSTPAPYARVLAFNDRGRRILNAVKGSCAFRNAGEAAAGDYWLLEQRCADLYGLFACGEAEPPGGAARQRIFYHTERETQERLFR